MLKETIQYKRYILTPKAPQQRGVANKEEGRQGMPQKDTHVLQPKTRITLKIVIKHTLHRNNQGSFKNSLFGD